MLCHVFPLLSDHATGQWTPFIGFFAGAARQAASHRPEGRAHIHGKILLEVEVF